MTILDLKPSDWQREDRAEECLPLEAYSAELSKKQGRTIGLVTGSGAFYNKLRSDLGSLFNHFDSLTLADLGCYEGQPSGSEYTQLETDLTSKGLTPVVIGTFGQFSGSGSGLVSITNAIPMNLQPKDGSFIGYQRHLLPQRLVQDIETFSYSCLSLGKLRSHQLLAEPHMRNTEVLHVSLNSVRRSDAPSISGTLPTGLQAEELCQLMKYAGTSSMLRVVYIDLVEGSNPGEAESMLIAESIWYLLEGLNMQYNDQPGQKGEFSSFIVHSSHYDDDIEFIKNNITSRWWLVKTHDNKSRQYLPCAQDEYQQTISGDVPERLHKFLDQV